MVGRIFAIEPRRCNKSHILIALGKFFHTGCLQKEIHLLLGDSPELVQNHVNIHHVLDRTWRDQLCRFVEQTDISGHYLIDTLPLNFDDNIFPSLQNRPVDLCDRCRSQWMHINALEHFVPLITVGLADHFCYLFKWHRCHFGMKPHQFFTIDFRKNVGMQ